MIALYTRIEAADTWTFKTVERDRATYRRNILNG